VTVEGKFIITSGINCLSPLRSQRY